MKDLFVVEVIKPVSGYAFIPHYFIGPFASEKEAERWVNRNQFEEQAEIHVLNPISRDHRDWLSNS